MYELGLERNRWTLEGLSRLDSAPLRIRIARIRSH